MSRTSPDGDVPSQTRFQRRINDGPIARWTRVFARADFSEDETMSDHHCHALGCKSDCPPRWLMCRPCWSRVPPDVQAEVYRTVRLRGLTDVTEAAVRAIDRGVFEACDNEPECRDESEPMTQSQWCDACRADHEIRTALTTVERVRAATGL